MSVDEYSKAVSLVGVRIGIKVYELVKRNPFQPLSRLNSVD